MMKLSQVITLVTLSLSLSTALQAMQLQGSPSLQEKVNNGSLPSVENRLPQDFKIAQLTAQQKEGKHGGQLRLLMGKQKDIRQIVVYSYARLVAYTPEYELKPDILQDIEVIDNRIFTLHLRKGHKWSDGHPFTSEDFRYYWEDIANNVQLYKSGLPKQLLVNGKGPKVEFPDETTIRYSWSQPNHLFLPALAGPRPLYIYKPAHYLKQFHASYQTTQHLDELIKKASARNWMGLHVNKDRPYKATNPDLPTLQPWINTTYPPSERFIFARNPFYYRVDDNGLQLPYIDSIAVNIVSSRLVPAKTSAGEADLQARYLRMDNYTFLKQAEKRNDFKVRLWQTAKGSHMALYPNLNTNNAVMKKLLLDLRFRQAMSHAINRHEVNQVVFFGLATEGNNTVMRQSPLFKKEYQNLGAEFNLQQANNLLDEIGLTQRDDRGVRLLPNGEPLEIMVQTAGESTEQTDVLELIHDSWLKAGIKLYTIPSTREVFRNRIFSGDAVMSIWSGLPNALATPNSNPENLAPTAQDQYQWPKWGQYFESSGKQGIKPELPVINELLELNNQWCATSNYQEREHIWHRMLNLNREQVFTLGIVNNISHPVVINKHLHNVPVKGFYHFNPGSYFGIYKPDTFWFDEERR